MFEKIFARMEELQNPKKLVEAIKIIAEEADKLVPVDTGSLKNSQEITENSIRYTADYAIYVHEDLQASHPHGEAKWLEKAFKNKEDEFMKKFME